MNLARVEPIVNAVLYEGYMLYPYRASSVKNRQRWTFGGIYPRDLYGDRRKQRLEHADGMPAAWRPRDRDRAACPVSAPCQAGMSAS